VSKFFLALRILAAAAGFAFAIPVATLAAEPAARFDVGYNEDWFGDDYLFSFIKTFDASYVDKTFAGIKAGGASVVRIYLFQARQGLLLNQYAPQSAGIDPRMLANLTTVLESARAHGLKIYFTLLDADAMPPPPESELRDYYYNLIHNNYGELDAFNARVLAPVLELLDQHRDEIYGLDIANEIQGAIKHKYWGFFDEFDGPRRWIKTERDFIKSRAPWIRVTSDAMGPADIAGGLYTGLGLDFYDVHVYDDKGDIPHGDAICELVRKTGVPIIVGEFGQLTQKLDDALQENVTRNLLRNAKSSCFSGAIAWRYDSADKTWRYQRPDGTMRPAAAVIRGFADMAR
jgi:hypothetical protein